MGISTVTDFDSTNPGAKLTELKQLLSHKANEGKTIMLVEGSDDRTFYVRYVSEPHVVVSVLSTCFFMPQILKLAKSDKILSERVIGIKDADFDRILGKNYQLDNLFLTDTHDWETMAQTNESERNVSIEALGRAETGVFTKVMNDLKNYSYFKLYNIVEICDKRKDGISFKNFAISNVYDGDNPCKIDICIEKVKEHNNNYRHLHFPSKEDIERIIKDYPQLDLLQITCGHDFIQGIVQRMIFLNNKKSNNKKSIKIGVTETARIFRISYTKEMFKTTRLYQDIYKWSKKNKQVVWAA